MTEASQTALGGSEPIGGRPRHTAHALHHQLGYPVATDDLERLSGIEVDQDHGELSR